jgi:hypothetical protein
MVDADPTAHLSDVRRAGIAINEQIGRSEDMGHLFQPEKPPAWLVVMCCWLCWYMFYIN